ncbi:hypothetical protein NX059_009165 [Plenodomus lindquistii]|nr:hypothetical protein NX059_009165 [Plenodomus lindquistii]
MSMSTLGNRANVYGYGDYLSSPMRRRRRRRGVTEFGDGYEYAGGESDQQRQGRRRRESGGGCDDDDEKRWQADLGIRRRRRSRGDTDADADRQELGTGSVYTDADADADASYMRGQQSRTPTPPPPLSPPPAPNFPRGYGAIYPPSLALPNTDVGVEEDTASILSSNDRLKYLEGLYDSEPYARGRERRVREGIMRERERMERMREREQRERDERDRGEVWDYGTGAKGRGGGEMEVEGSVAPGDSISQVGVSHSQSQSHHQSRHTATLPPVHERPFKTQNQYVEETTVDISYPRQLTPVASPHIPAGPLSPTPPANLQIRKVVRLASSISRFLLAAPQDPGCKTYSKRFPPADSYAALLRGGAQDAGSISLGRETVSRLERRGTVPSMTMGGTTVVSPAPASANPPPPTLSTHTHIPLLKKPSLLFSRLGRNPKTSPTTRGIDKSTISAPMPVVDVYPESGDVGAATDTDMQVSGVLGERVLRGDESAVTAWPEEDETGVVKVGRMSGAVGLRGGEDGVGMF